MFGVWQNTWWQNKQLYNSDDAQYKQFTNVEWSHIENATFYAGRFKKETTHTFSDVVNLERTAAVDLGGNNSPSFQGYSAFPNVSDYIRACNMFNTIYNIDSTQDNPRDFKNNSWLGDSYDQWTINSENNTTEDDDFWVLETDIIVGLVETHNNISGRTFNLPQQYRPVFYLKNDTILSGTGTVSDAFTVMENWSWFDPLQVQQ